jgi:hypothetical protein
MKTRLLALALVLASLAAASAGCTIVTPPGKDGGTPKPKPFPVPIPIRPDALPQPPPLEASVLFVANLQRSSANLAGQYASLMTKFLGDLPGSLQVVNMGLISTYGDQFGPRLLLGRSAAAGQPASTLALLGLLAQYADAGISNYNSLLPIIGGTLGNIDDADLQPALQLLAGSGNFDGNGVTSEAANLIGFGQGLNAFALPPELGGIDRSAFFDVPHDLFIIVYLQPLPRRCQLGNADCDVNGQSPSDIFLQTDGYGGASWLHFSYGSIPPAKVVQVAIATSEGESETAFEARCTAVPGFPQNDFDVIGPSANAYFTPLMSALNAAYPGTGQNGDFCTLIGSKADSTMRALATSAAALATH